MTTPPTYQPNLGLPCLTVPGRKKSYPILFFFPEFIGNIPTALKACSAMLGAVGRHRLFNRRNKQNKQFYTGEGARTIPGHPTPYK